MDTVDPVGPALLGQCLSRLDWTKEKLAREINKVAGANTISLKTPYSWLTGSTPREANIREQVAMVLGRALGEPISVSRLWPDAEQAHLVAVTAHSGLEMPWNTKASYACARLVGEPTRPTMLQVTGALAVVPVFGWFTSSPAAAPVRRDGEHLGPEVLAVLAERVGQLRHLDDVQGGQLPLDLTVHDMKSVAAIISSYSYDADTGRQLFAILAELSSLAGWMATDRKQWAMGQRLLLCALHFAHSADRPELAANIVSLLSYLALWQGVPADAVQLIRLARRNTTADMSPATRALLASREGRAHAAAGEHRECARALDEATQLYDLRWDDAVPPWAYWVTRGVLVSDAGRAWCEAGRPELAEPLLAQGIQLLGDDQPRNRLLHGLSLAMVRLQLADVDGAVDAAQTALVLAAYHSSARIRARLSELGVAFAGVESRTVSEVNERISDLVHR